MCLYDAYTKLTIHLYIYVKYAYNYRLSIYLYFVSEFNDNIEYTNVNNIE